MRERPADPLHLDVRAFTRDDGQLEGAWPLAGFTRLCDLLEPADAPPPVTWSARGRMLTGAGDSVPAIDLAGAAVLTLQCQRCLQPIDWPVTVATRFRFAATEAEAARLDAESEDDVLAMPRELDLRALLEDELLLALPLVPRHADCSPPLPADGGDGDDQDVAANPFAALAALKKRHD